MNLSNTFRSTFTGEPVTWVTQGWGALGVGAAGTLSGAFIVEGSNDNETWTRLSNDAGADSVNEAGHYRYDVAGYEQVKFSPLEGTTVDMVLDGLGVP